MNNMDIYWVWLSTLKYVGPIFQKRLLAQFGPPEAVFSAPMKVLEMIPKINKRRIESLLNNRDLTEANNILQQCHKKGIKLLSFFDPLYPQYAKQHPESPILFYVLGQLKEINHAIGVVGS